MMRKVITVVSTLTSLALAASDTWPPGVTRETRDKASVLHVSSDTDTGTIVKTFPHDLPGLSLLQSRDSEKFFLLGNGDLMLARPLDCLAGSNLSLALTHHVLNQTVLHLVDIHVHGAGQFLEFEQSEYVFSVRENQPPDTRVGSVTLSGQNTRNLEFSLYPAMARKKFMLSPSLDNSSVIMTLRTLKPLDREVDKRITLRLVATNRESHETASARVNVFVKNENDNAPVFINKIYSLKVPVKSHRFSVMGMVSAKDGDGDQIVYSLVRRTGPFIVVPQTGEILLTEDPQLKMYLLQVEAKDRGVPPLKSKPALVYISFEDDEELSENSVNSTHSRVKRRVTRAVRPTKRTEFTEADGEPEGKIVFQLEKESEHETFKIRDENPWVTVEPNGAVRVKKKWDYEELGREKTIDFWVIITNSGSGGEYGQSLLVIIICCGEGGGLID